MSKVPSDNLFHLIHALSKSEKAYFKYTYQKDKEQTFYLKLFDAIEQQKKYDEEALRQKFKIGPVRMRNSKFYLYNNILRSLELFNYSSQSNFTLMHYLLQAEILQKKGLFKQSENILEKGKKLAHKFDKPLFEAEFLKLENRISSPKNATDIESLFNKLFYSIEKYINTIELSQLYELARYYTILNKTHSNNATEKELKKIANNPLINNKIKALGFLALKTKYKVLSTIAQYTKDHKNADLMVRKILQLYERHPQQISDDFEGYFIAIENLIVSKLNTKDYKGAIQFVKKASLLKSKIKHLSLHRYFRSFCMELLYYFNIADFDKAYRVIKEEEKHIADVIKSESSTKFKLEIFIGLYSISYTCFIVGDYYKAKKYLHIILGRGNEVPSDIYSYSKLLFLIIHYELEEYELLSSLVNSTNRYLLSRNIHNKIATLYLAFFKKIASTSVSKEGLVDLYNSTLTAILSVDKNSEDAKILNYFDFVTWVESKKDNVPFIKYLQKKNKVLLK